MQEFFYPLCFSSLFCELGTQRHSDATLLGLNEMLCEAFGTIADTLGAFNKCQSLFSPSLASKAFFLKDKAPKEAPREVPSPQSKRSGRSVLPAKGGSHPLPWVPPSESEENFGLFHEKSTHMGLNIIPEGPACSRGTVIWE